LTFKDQQNFILEKVNKLKLMFYEIID